MIMKRKRQRKRKCRHCGKSFLPDCRQKTKQHHCSEPACQTVRSNGNIRDWYQKNPDCLEEQRKTTKQWFKNHPDYWPIYRRTNPDKTRNNRINTKARMRQNRDQKLFAKTNSIFSQLVDNKADRCFLSERSGWLHLRLQKQTRYTRYRRLCKNLAGIHPKRKSLPASKVYDLGRVVMDKGS